MHLLTGCPSLYLFKEENSTHLDAILAHLEPPEAIWKALEDLCEALENAPKVGTFGQTLWGLVGKGKGAARSRGGGGGLLCKNEQP